MQKRIEGKSYGPGREMPVARRTGTAGAAAGTEPVTAVAATEFARVVDTVDDGGADCC